MATRNCTFHGTPLDEEDRYNVLSMGEVRWEKIRCRLTKLLILSGAGLTWMKLI
ncbi:MAG: hypothetical protein ABGX04_16820 [Myxococcales bacterium]